MNNVRTRFAPSPTGFMHVGGVRTALFAWLIAKQNHGQFILRLEDTDQNREVAGSSQHIIETLKALDLKYDEGPDIGGPYGPYIQSKRLEIYHQWAIKLIEQGRAYADVTSPQKLQSLRDQSKKANKPFLFRDYRPTNPPQWDGTTPLRFKSVPIAYQWTDAVMGPLSAGEEAVDDFIIIKSDGFPTYNFAHIVDDYLMKISHVIRSQEFLASIPRFLNLYEALNITPPILATMPFVMGPDGHKKLSKRDGAKDVLDYIRDGFLPEALINFIASLGWNDGSTQEIFTTEELIQKFSLTRVQKSGAKFDEQRLLWMNGVHIRQLDLEQLLKVAEPFWPDEASNFSSDYKKQVLGLVQDRIKYLKELPTLSNFFFTDLPLNPDLIHNNKQLSKLTSQELKQLLTIVLTNLKQSDFTLPELTKRLNDLLDQTHQKPAVLFSLIRIATTQAPFSPALADTLATLGKKVCLNRLQQQVDAL